MKADVSDTSSLFGNPLLQFCTHSGLILSRKVLLSENSFTYISETWLDHCLCTADAHDSTDVLEIEYDDMATTDQIRVFCLCFLQHKIREDRLG